MDDPEQETGQHQPNGGFWIDPRTAGISRVEIGNIVPKPGQIENPVHSRKHMIIWNEIT